MEGIIQGTNEKKYENKKDLIGKKIEDNLSLILGDLILYDMKKSLKGVCGLKIGNCGPWILVNSSFNLISEERFVYVNFDGDLIYCLHEDGNVKYLDWSGGDLFGKFFGSGSTLFRNGIGVVDVGGKFNYLDLKTKKYLNNEHYLSASLFFGNYAFVERECSKGKVFIDKSFNVLEKLGEFEEIYDVSNNGIALVRKKGVLKKEIIFLG